MWTAAASFRAGAVSNPLFRSIIRPLFMLELQQKGKTAGTETTQQERRLSLIGLQDIPVEGFAGTAISGAGSVEKKVIAKRPHNNRRIAGHFSVL